VNIWGAISAVLASALCYSVGFQHGTDKAEFAIQDPIVRFEPYPFAEECSIMLEAAWSIKDKAPDVVSPHKP